jgi:hypothetical protein
MKKFKFIGFTALLFVSIFILSCNKSEVISSQEFSLNTENDDLKRNEATWINLGPEKVMGLGFKIFVGHTAKDCGGKCLKIFGEYGHADCRGFGHVCNRSVSAYYSTGPDPDFLTLILTEADAFGEDLQYPLPNRSLYITNPQNNTELWLNIPEQILERTDAEESFVIQNAWFSEEQELENE